MLASCDSKRTSLAAIGAKILGTDTKVRRHKVSYIIQYTGYDVHKTFPYAAAS